LWTLAFVGFELYDNGEGEDSRQGEEKRVPGPRIGINQYHGNQG
jgi:hypothetical protein